VRLTNTNGQSKSTFIRVVARAYLAPGYGYSATHTNPQYWQFAGYGADPSYSYLWDFPSGMDVIDNTVFEAEFTNAPYTGFYPAYATLKYSNLYCPSYEQTVEIYDILPRPGRTVRVLPTVEASAGKKTVVYPNPSSASFRLQPKKPVRQVSLYTMQGRLVRSFNSVTDGAVYDIGNVANATYLVTIVYADGDRETQLLIKR
jgi:hypothetical protein